MRLDQIEVKSDPQWLTHNDWKPETRLKYLREIMVFDSRDWSKYIIAMPGEYDPVMWSVYCLAVCHEKETAIKYWSDFCIDVKTKEVQSYD